MTPEEYLEIERKAEFRSEYWGGGMCAVGGAGANHNAIVFNVAAEVRQGIRSRPCAGYAQDMRVRVSATGLYTYPDVVVACDKPQYLGAQQDTLLNPTLVIEVLSPSTEAYDRGAKFELYRSIESLREYVLISSERILVERFLRHTTEEWLLTAVNRMEGSIHLDSIGLDLRLADLYEKVEFAPTGPMIRPLHAG